MMRIEQLNTKRNMAGLLLCAGSGLFAAFSPAEAADGTVNITGSIVSSTCKVNGGTPDMTVALDNVAETSLATAGAIAGRKAFTFNLTGCAASVGTVTKRVGVFFESGANVNAAGRLNLASNSTASKVDVALFSRGAATPLVIGNVASQNYVDIDSTGAATVSYEAGYYATGKAGAGTVATSVQYTLVYP